MQGCRLEEEEAEEEEEPPTAAEEDVAALAEWEPFSSRPHGFKFCPCAASEVAEADDCCG